EYCMYELFTIYQNSRMDAADFQRRIIPIILPDAGLSGDLQARLQPALHWSKQKKELDILFEQNGEVFGDNAFRAYKRIGEFARNTSDMIDHLLDQLQRRDYDRQLEEGFTELCQQILED
ncbi:MAG: hypothetical protein ACK5QW_02185, partial [Cyanobacteriota bacterium]